MKIDCKVILISIAILCLIASAQDIGDAIVNHLIANNITVSKIEINETGIWSNNTRVVGDGMIDKGALFLSTDRYFHGWFESLDGYNKTTTGTASIAYSNLQGCIKLSTGSTQNSIAELYKFMNVPFRNLSYWIIPRFFKVCVCIWNDSDQEIWLINGQPSTDEHIGFKIANNSLYGSVADGTTENSVLLEIFETSIAAKCYELEVRFYPSDRAEFYVDGVLRGITKANLPRIVPNAAVVFYSRIENLAPSDKVIKIGEWELYVGS